MALTSLQLMGQEDSDIITIELQKESYLTSVYIENTHSHSTDLLKSYLKEIEDVLRFNFNHNGRTKVISQKDLGDGTYMANRLSKEWELFGVEYVIKLDLTDNYLTLSVLSTVEDRICFAEEVKLAQNLEQDRLKIHRCSENIHQLLFDEKGIYLSQILYTLKSKKALSASQPWISEVYQCDWDGANPRQVTKEENYCVTPSYYKSKDRESIDSFFYVSYKIGQPKIYWASFSEKEGKRLTHLRGNQLMPAVSPNGDQIAFINDAPGNPELFVQDFRPHIGAIGKPRQIFACKRGAQASPTYSPDGKQIAFVSNKDGSPKIYTINVPQEGESQRENKPKLITRVNGENTRPCWSPDGTKLAYIGRVDGVRQVWIYDFVLQKEWQLTYGPGNKENPVWAHNSLHLVFNSVGNASCELYLVSLNQPKVMRIQTLPGLKRFPVWINRD
ncbi:MAG: Tol-Pal system protein TolB [Chlamydiae bacterium]|nr:Tol-Pal system protein TolB [Chlamydiota bacterium]